MNNSEYANIAVPYYGSIARAGYGFENIYILASACRKTGKIINTKVDTWCGRTADNLSLWLVEKNIEGIFSNGFSLALEKELDKAKIWSRWNISGEIEDIAQQHWQNPEAD